MLLPSAEAAAQRAAASDLGPVAAIGSAEADIGRLRYTVAAPLPAGFTAGDAQSAPAPTQRDSVLNGVLIGAGVGALVGLIPDHYDDCEECHDSLYASIGVGAGVGLLVDLLRGQSAGAPASGPRASLSLGVGARSAHVRIGGVVRWR